MFVVHAPPSGAWKDAAALADWIEQQVPCYEIARPVPLPLISQLLKVFKDNRIPNTTVIDALDELAGRGIKINLPPDFYAVQISAAAPKIPRMSENSRGQATIGAPTTSPKRRIQDTFAYYDERLQYAILSGSSAEAEQILQAILDLLWAWMDAEGSSRKDSRPEDMLKWEEINQAVNEAFERAHVSEHHIRQLSREDWEQMRRAPTPGSLKNIQIRLSRTILQKHRARRSVRRRTRR